MGDSSTAPTPPLTRISLFTPFALLTQLLLASLALSSTLIKRKRENPRRPYKIWAFDTARQAIAGMAIHAANLLVSEGRATGELNPTAWYGSEITCAHYNRGADIKYFLNIGLDTTIGVGFLYLIITASNRIISRLNIHVLDSGVYGYPPQTKPFLLQTIVFTIQMSIMKLCILPFFSIHALGTLANWILWPLRHSPNAEIFFVMFMFPLVMNIFMYWACDQMLQAKSVSALRENGLVAHSRSTDSLLGGAWPANILEDDDDSFGMQQNGYGTSSHDLNSQSHSPRNRI